jgi:hypothetical protein
MEKLPYVMCNELLNAKNKSGVKKWCNFNINLNIVNYHKYVVYKYIKKIFFLFLKNFCTFLFYYLFVYPYFTDYKPT